MKENPGPAVGVNVREVENSRPAADAGRQGTRSQKVSKSAGRGGSPSASAVHAYRALPETLRHRIPEHGSRRVLRILDQELEHRTPAELAARILRRWESWRYVLPEEIDDITAVAVTLSRRGYPCPDVLCEDNVSLYTGQPCNHCTAPRPAPEPLSAAQGDAQDRAEPIHPPRAEHGSRPHPEDHDPAVRGGALARRLLTIRTSGEREKIINEAEQDH